MLLGGVGILFVFGVGLCVYLRKGKKKDSDHNDDIYSLF